MGLVALVDAPIDVPSLIERTRTDACGAVVAFLGVVRERSAEDPRAVIALSYEAYGDMALREMQAIGDEAAARFGILEIALVHRTGRLTLGETSVAIVVAAPHRAAALDACEFAIEALKERVEVFKREEYADGEGAWIANRPSLTQ
jgi:molybdopterin synthase catalytic subunit